MRSKPQWYQEDDCLFFLGSWTHESVSAVWHSVCKQSVQIVNVAQVKEFDSAFLTLLLQLLPVTHQALMLQGANAPMRSLLTLYNLTSILTIEAEL